MIQQLLFTAFLLGACSVPAGQVGQAGSSHLPFHWVATTCRSQTERPQHLGRWNHWSILLLNCGRLTRGRGIWTQRWLESRCSFSTWRCSSRTVGAPYHAIADRLCLCCREFNFELGAARPALSGSPASFLCLNVLAVIRGILGCYQRILRKDIGGFHVIMYFLSVHAEAGWQGQHACPWLEGWEPAGRRLNWFPTFLS